MSDFIINLGSEVKDKITGYKGIVRSRSQYLTGCNTYGVQTQSLTKEGNPREWKWFDEDQLIVLKDKKVVIYEEEKVKKSKRVGGPLEDSHFPPS